MRAASAASMMQFRMLHCAAHDDAGGSGSVPVQDIIVPGQPAACASGLLWQNALRFRRMQ